MKKMHTVFKQLKSSNRPWADGGPHAPPPHYLHSLVFSFTPGSVDLEKAC